MSENSVKNYLKNRRSKCCNAPVKLDGMPDFIGSKEVVTVHHVCTKCKKPCKIYKLDESKS